MPESHEAQGIQGVGGAVGMKRDGRGQRRRASGREMTAPRGEGGRTAGPRALCRSRLRAVVSGVGLAGAGARGWEEGDSAAVKEKGRRIRGRSLPESCVRRVRDKGSGWKPERLQGVMSRGRAAREASSAWLVSVGWWAEREDSTQCA